MKATDDNRLVASSSRARFDSQPRLRFILAAKVLVLEGASIPLIRGQRYDCFRPFCHRQSLSISFFFIEIGEEKRGGSQVWHLETWSFWDPSPGTTTEGRGARDEEKKSRKRVSYAIIFSNQPWNNSRVTLSLSRGCPRKRTRFLASWKMFATYVGPPIIKGQPLRLCQPRDASEEFFPSVKFILRLFLCEKMMTLATI